MRLEQIDLQYYPPELSLRTQHKDGTHIQSLKLNDAISVDEICSYFMQQSSVLKHYSAKSKELASILYLKNKSLPNPAYLKTQRTHIGAITCLVADKQLSKLVSCGFDNTTQVYKLDESANLQQVQIYDHPDKVLSCLLFNDQVFTSCFDGTVRLFNNDSVTEFFVEKDRELPTALFLNNSSVAYGNAVGATYLFDINRNEQPLYKFQKHGSEVIKIQQIGGLSQTFITAGLDGALFLHDTRHLEQSARLSAGSRSQLSKHEKPVTSMLLKDNFVTSASETSVRLNDVRMPGQILYEWKHNNGICLDMQFGFQEIGILFDKSLQFLDPNFQSTRRLSMKSESTCFKFLPRGFFKRILVGTNNGIELYEGEKLLQQFNKGGIINDIIINEAGTTAVAAGHQGDLVVFKDPNIKE